MGYSLSDNFKSRDAGASKNMLVCIRVDKCTLTAKKWQRVQNRWVKRFLLHIIFAIYVATYTFSSAKLFVWESCWCKKNIPQHIPLSTLPKQSFTPPALEWMLIPFCSFPPIKNRNEQQLELCCGCPASLLHLSLR